MTKHKFVIMSCMAAAIVASMAAPSGSAGLVAGSGLAPSGWPMRGHDAGLTGRAGNPGPAYGLEKWHVDAAGAVSPVAGPDGTLYFGYMETSLYETTSGLGAIYPDGTKKWVFPSYGDLQGSPAVGSDGNVYVATSMGRVYSVSKDGRQNWMFTTAAGIQSSPSIGPDGTIYIGCEDAKLYALNPDGTQRWVFTGTGQIRSTPSVGPGGDIYVMCLDGHLIAISPMGKKVWDRRLSSLATFYDASPAIGTSGTIYVGGDDFHAINPDDGADLWTFRATRIRLGGYQFTRSPAIGPDGTVYACAQDSTLYAIDGQTGRRKWVHFPVSDANPSVGSDGTVYLGTVWGKIVALNPDGTQEWLFDRFPGVASGSPCIGPDGFLYVGSRYSDNWLANGSVYCLGMTPTSLTISARSWVARYRPITLAGAVSHGNPGDRVRVEVKKPNSKVLWSVASTRTANRLTPTSAVKWSYRYTPTLHGKYQFRVRLSRTETRTASVSRVISVFVK